MSHGSTPNVYFISFEFLIPESLTDKHMGLESTEFHIILNTNFKKFENVFSDQIGTWPPLNSLLALDISYWDSANYASQGNKFFSGARPSPLFQIVKHNGYETTTHFKGEYFGRFKGPFVDNYGMVDLDPNSDNQFEYLDGKSWFSSLGPSWDFININSTMRKVGVWFPKTLSKDITLTPVFS